MIRRIYRIALLCPTLLVLAAGVILRLRDAGLWPGSPSEPAGGSSWGGAEAAGGGLTATFLGQDGGGFVGIDCTRDPTPDNIHISFGGLPDSVTPVGWEVSDAAGFGLWALPCNGRNWWLAAEVPGDGTADLFMKPHRDAPDGARYGVTVRYADGSAASAVVEGTAVRVRLP